MPSVRVTACLYVLAMLLIGLGYVAVLPYFEGFDETAHYSTIRQIADTGTVPSYGMSYLDTEVTSYPGPRPYGSGNPPFDQGLTYRKFFQSSELTESFLANVHHTKDATPFSPSREQNWEAQHPPLYYLLMAPIARCLRNTSLLTRIFVLRLVSFILAIAGVFFGLIAVLGSQSASFKSAALIGFLVYPIVLPMFFPEFARMGNDSLCLFLVGLTAWLMAKWQRNLGNIKLAALVGIVLGAGLLTKAFFLPIIAAVVIFYAMALIRSGKASVTACRGVAIACVVALFIGGWWYLHGFLIHGTIVGDANSIHLKANAGGLLANLSHGSSLFEIIRGFASTCVSFVWAGTWSLTRFPVDFEAPLVALAGLCFLAFLLQMRRRPSDDPGWLAIWCLMLFGIGFAWHIVDGILLSGNAQTPGWYLHILVPWTAPALGVGILGLLKAPRMRVVTICLLIYAGLFQVMAIWAQVCLFAGCATKGDTKTYVFSDSRFCIDQSMTLMHRLSILAYPTVALVGYTAGMICLLLLVGLPQSQFSHAIRKIRNSSYSPRLSVAAQSARAD